MFNFKLKNHSMTMKKGLAPATLTFIADLRKNNLREWFQENKARYEAARHDYIDFLDALLPAVAAFEPVAAGQQGKDLLFRIYRDVRFSHNKSPYKDHFGAYLAEGGRKSINPGYYLHIAPQNGSFIAIGLWMPPPGPLKAVRQEIDYNLAEFEGFLSAPDFAGFFGPLEGEKLKTTPKGYTPDNPALPYLRHKSWMVSHPLPDALVTSEALLGEVVNAMKLAQPFKEFLMHPMREVSGTGGD
jgi:uncharacterized protein (TIGR02453 family)